MKKLTPQERKLLKMLYELHNACDSLIGDTADNSDEVRVAGKAARMLREYREYL